MLFAISFLATQGILRIFETFVDELTLGESIVIIAIFSSIITVGMLWWRDRNG